MLEMIKMPSMGATMEEGTISVWHVTEGDTVNEGDILFEFESDKSTFEFESPCDGVIRKVLAEEGDTVAVLETVAIVGDLSDSLPENL